LQIKKVQILQLKTNTKSTQVYLGYLMAKKIDKVGAVRSVSTAAGCLPVYGSVIFSTIPVPDSL